MDIFPMNIFEHRAKIQFYVAGLDIEGDYRRLWKYCGIELTYTFNTIQAGKRLLKAL